jgi:hypothetical protein
MDTQSTKMLLYTIAVVIVAAFYFVFIMASTAKTTKITETTKATKINSSPEKPRCLRILDIPLNVTRRDLEADLKRYLPTYGPECYLTLAHSPSTLTATVNSLKFPKEFPYLVDETFIGITPIFDGDNASVE